MIVPVTANLTKPSMPLRLLPCPTRAGWHYTVMPSPIGALMLVGSEVDGKERLHRLKFEGESSPFEADPTWTYAPDGLAPVRAQINAYFAGFRSIFDLDLAPPVTDFQREVLAVLATLPFGETRSYGEIARAIGKPAASRAVGAANGANPIPLILPCHRVIGSTGKLTGFAGGLERKRFLLAHEARQRELFPT